ncbi:MAG: hypothetical protein V4437_01765 [Patescibacteria group bacterium]
MPFNKERAERIGVETLKVVGINIGSEVAVEVLKVIIRGIH